jgi:hypothetical protein
MIAISSRDELVGLLYGEFSLSPETLVGVARISGELLAEALTNEYAPGQFHIGEFCPIRDESGEITVDREGNILSDHLSY